MKQLTGRIKQAAGSLIGNRKLEREGRSQRRSGQARQRFDDATDKVRNVIDTSVDDAADTVGHGIDTSTAAVADAMKPDRTANRPT